MKILIAKKNDDKKLKEIINKTNSFNISIIKAKITCALFQDLNVNEKKLLYFIYLCKIIGLNEDFLIIYNNNFSEKLLMILSKIENNFLNKVFGICVNIYVTDNDLLLKEKYSKNAKRIFYSEEEVFCRELLK